MSPEIGKLAEALAKAQGIMENAARNKDNAFLKSKYSTLTATWEACRHALSSNGLCVIQSPEFEGDQLILTTILAHCSGEYIKSKLPITPKDKSSQAQGSAITYARRYALAAIVGISPDEDSEEEDDGNYNNDKYADHRKKSPNSPINKQQNVYADHFQKENSDDDIENDFYFTFKDLNQELLKKYISTRPNPFKIMKDALRDQNGFRIWFIETEKKKQSSNIDKKSEVIESNSTLSEEVIEAMKSGKI
jgi:hypothetical protein